MAAKRRTTAARRGRRAKNYPKGADLVDVFSRILLQEATDFDRLLELDPNRPTRSSKIAALIREYIRQNRRSLGGGD